MAVGRISGPLLKSNLLRNGVNLAFETNLLYLDVVNSRVGIKTTTPSHDLQVVGTTRTTTLEITSNTITIGEITISGNSLSSTNSVINLNPTGVNAVVYQGTLVTGNLTLSGNTIQATNSGGNINITTQGSGQVNFNSNVLINGNLHATGNITADGNIQLGNQTSDTVTFTAEVNSDIIPSQTNTYSLGSSSYVWKNVFTNSIDTNGVVINNNTITTSNNSNLILAANGSGYVSIPSNDVSLGQQLTVVGLTTVGATAINGDITQYSNTTQTGTITQTGDINQTGTYNLTGTLNITDNITLSGYLQLPGITFNGNIITTTVPGTDLVLSANGSGNVVMQGFAINNNTIQPTSTDTDIVLTPSGTGSVVINNGLIIPVGNSASRPIPASAGMIRYNTDLSRYEGYSDPNWLPLGGVSDAAGNTYILPESSPGAGDNVLYFYVNNTLMSYIDATKWWSTRFETNQLAIYDNNITTVLSGTDINLTTSGTGGVVLGYLKINNNTITNTVANSITTFNESGTGYVKFASTAGVVIPSGNGSTDRPSVREVGMMRFNTDDALIEVWTGSTWSSGTGVSVYDAIDIGIQMVLTLG